MADFYSLCPGCEAMVGTFDLETYPSERIEHYQCEDCGCVWATSYQLTNEHQVIHQEGDQ
jgi:hypothetical protein